MFKLAIIFKPKGQPTLVWDHEQILKVLLREMPERSHKDLLTAWNKLIKFFKQETIRM